MALHMVGCPSAVAIYGGLSKCSCHMWWAVRESYLVVVCVCARLSWHTSWETHLDWCAASEAVEMSPHFAAPLPWLCALAAAQHYTTQHNVELHNITQHGSVSPHCSIHPAYLLIGRYNKITIRASVVNFAIGFMYLRTGWNKYMNEFFFIKINNLWLQ